MTDTDDEQNRVKFMEVISKFDPELYLIKIALEETGVNGSLIPPIIRILGNLHLGTGFGKIQIFMQNGVITQIKSEESVLIDRDAVNP